MTGDIELWADGEIIPLKSQHPPFAIPPRDLTRDEASVYEQGLARAAEIDVRWRLQGQASRTQAEHAKETQEIMLDTTQTFVRNLNAITDPDVRRMVSGPSQNLLRLHDAGQLGYYQTTMLGVDEILTRDFRPPQPTLRERLTGEG